MKTKQYTGVLVALFLPREAAERLAQAAAQAMPDAVLIPASELHLTLASLGDSALLGDDVRRRLLGAVYDCAVGAAGPIAGVISGVGRFTAPEGEPHPVYASFDSPDLAAFREQLWAHLRMAGLEPRTDHGFTPHITLAYLAPDAPTPDLALDALPLVCDTVTLAWGDSHFTFPLRGAKAETRADPVWRVGARADLPIARRDSWDGAAAAGRIFAWAGFDGATPAPARARQGFLAYDAANAELRGSYKLPFADVVDGELTAIDAGLRAAASRLPQADLPEAVRTRAREVLDRYFERLDDKTAPRPRGRAGGIPMREIKAAPHYTKAITGRTVTGIFSVFGNVDSYDDIAMPGMFAKTFQERGGQFLHLWQHDFDSPPIAVIRGVREIGREELPPAVLRDYPTALGGAEVTREYLPTPRADEVLAALMAGSPLQMSFAYDPLKFDFGTFDERPVRYLREVRLWETSDVNWGANSATVAAKGGLPLETLALHLDRYLSARKAGARHSATDIKLLNQIHRAAVELGCTTCAGLLDEDAEGAKIFLRREPAQQGQPPVGVTGLWLRAQAGRAQVLAEVDGQWKLAIDEPLIQGDDGLISHIVEPLGIRQAASDPFEVSTEPSRAADQALTRARRLRLAQAALRQQGS